MQTVTVGADPRVRPDYRNVTAHVDVHFSRNIKLKTVGEGLCARPIYINVTAYVDVHRADAGVRPYRNGLHQ